MGIKSFIVVIVLCLATMFILAVFRHYTVIKRRPSTTPHGTMEEGNSFLHDGTNHTATVLESTENTEVQPNLLSSGYRIMMTVRLSSNRRLLNYFYCTMLRSAALFWSPKLSNITVILDEESKKDHEFAVRLQKQQMSLGFEIGIRYEPLPNDPNCLKAGKSNARGVVPFGYNRMLWGSFFMDLYTDADIVAWMDTDAMFSTPVTMENIFSGKRLRVKGVSTSISGRPTWERATRVALGKKMIANFMAYFPMYIWRDTFTNCRKYILQHLNVSNFEDAFKKIHKEPQQVCSTVCILLTYAYYFEHDRYDWHFDVVTNLRRFNIEHVQAGHKVTPIETSPDLHVTIHEKHYDQRRRKNPLKQGYCVAKAAVTDKLPPGCKEFHNITNFQLFEFEISSWQVQHLDTWCRETEGRKRCTELIQKHYQNVRKYHRKGWYDLDLQRVLNVETTAANVGITCSRIFDFSNGSTPVGILKDVLS